MPVWIRRVLLIIVGLALLAVLVWAFRPTPVPVDTTVVRRGAMMLTVDEDGRTRIKERYVISSPLAGRLARIQLDPGDIVVEGESVVAIIEPTDPRLLDARERAEAEARVRAAEAAVRRSAAEREQTRATLDHAENRLAELRDALEKGSAAPHEVQQQEAIYRRATEGFRAATFSEEIAAFELEQAKSALLHTRPGGDVAGRAQFPIAAPISGRVLRVLQESTAVLQPGTPLLEVGNPADLEVVVDVLSTDAVKIRPGDEVIIEHWGGEKPLTAKVRIVEPSAFTKISALGVEEQRVNVVSDFVTAFAERRALADGFRVEARIVLWRGRDEIVVPASALFRPSRGAFDEADEADDAEAAGGNPSGAGDDGWAVFVVERGRAVRRAVVIGRQTGLRAQVLEGLDPGETVIVHPSDKISDGVRIEARVGSS